MPLQEIALSGESIDDAAEEIITFLGRTRQESVICLDGLAASAILKVVVERYRSPLSGAAIRKASGGFDKIIHIEYLPWQSKRSLQKAIAEELKLPQKVMDFFNQCDDEDDFDGVEQAARGVIPDVKWAILSELGNYKFLVVFHNWSGNYVDLWEYGVPVMGGMNKRVLWTSGGRFRFLAIPLFSQDVKTSAGLSDVVISFFPYTVEGEDAMMDTWRHILHLEAWEVASWYSSVGELDTKIVLECILYKLMIQQDNNINWGTHAANYWVCDGIIHDTNGCDRSTWEIGDALHRTMNLDWHQSTMGFILELLCDEQRAHSDRWVSAAGQDIAAVQPLTTSFFWTGAIIEGGTLKDLDKSRLRVLHLSHCTFSFSSPPFISCTYLRFLLLDHCKDKNDAPNRSEEQDHSQVSDGACFQKLWVLEMSYTDWYGLLSKKMLDIMVELRELNVKGPSNWSTSHLHSCSDTGSSSKLLKLRVAEGPNDNNKGRRHMGSWRGSSPTYPPKVLASPPKPPKHLLGIDKGEEDEDEEEEEEKWERKEEEKNKPPFPLTPPLCSTSSFATVNNIGDSSGHRNQYASSFPDLSSWCFLKTVILDGCGELEEIGRNTLPPSLESFSFTSDISTKIKSISFRGCAILKSLMLRGSFGELIELDMSGTSVKTLDLSETQALRLKRLFLLGCEKLRAIHWPQEEVEEIIKLEVLHIDTTRAAWSREAESNKQEATSDSRSAISLLAAVHGNDHALANLDVYISLRDARLFRSLIGTTFEYLHIEITSSHKGASQGVNNVASGDSEQEVRAINLPNAAGNLYISTFEDISQSQTAGANGDIVDALIPMRSNDAHCYISIQDETPTQWLQNAAGTKQQTSTTLPRFVHNNAKILHLHDSLSITCIPGPASASATTAKLNWDKLQWCRIERCPNLEGSVFTTPPVTAYGNDIFHCLETFWASQLLKAHYIWDWSTSVFSPGHNSFEDLVFLHLDCCPNLVHVLPLYTSNGNGCRRLETLEIVCCGELREVFPSDSKSRLQQKPREFPNLKHIHLYELPMLQRIYSRRMLAPKLKTVKIRGCWSLKRLPAACRAPQRSTELNEEEAHMLPTVDCEKDWWDNLEWDGEEAGHHPSHYKPTHSAYYKKTLLRATVLR
ncbi:unnamed protein product [Urochloa decumbens]|uniref:Disease resistance protein At4g27190-like leucine-rich repeats domain-containing protein n=1 Tax=Urochloa decumbens TaxID=240449 RepID=A0ABC9C326_9POAL